MSQPWEIYDLLIDCVDKQQTIEELVIGLTWTLCRADGIGLAMSPVSAPVPCHGRAKSAA